jgi:hypothetical protein
VAGIGSFANSRFKTTSSLKTGNLHLASQATHHLIFEKVATSGRLISVDIN